MTERNVPGYGYVRIRFDADAPWEYIVQLDERFVRYSTPDVDLITSECNVFNFIISHCPHQLDLREYYESGTMTKI